VVIIHIVEAKEADEADTNVHKADINLLFVLALSIKNLFSMS